MQNFVNSYIYNIYIGKKKSHAQILYASPFQLIHI